ncbi:MAG: orotidine-5'-phosphate decarboxylase [Chloroflexota bacterium]|nr:orotidine-5'-phosphate decarboxylase [Chloroflexota bacterium]MDQ5867935.1 orotidine-5'-phosphate decarboxylase [Chloroflexota bacterium]
MIKQHFTWATRVSEAIAQQDSLLCVGLDPVYDKLPAEFRTGNVAQDIFAYNRRIIDGAAPYAAAFKPQYKCYSAEGEAGITALKYTCAYLRERYSHIPVILDAKYADIGHVLERCAHEAFDLLGVDAVTAMPAPGRQALAPLFTRPGKGCFMVVRTSNPGADELQDIQTANGNPLYVEITGRIAAWNESGNVGLVGPATDPAVLARIRQAAPHLPILCPGVGAQGGDVEAAVVAGLDANGAGLLINVSRAIMEASDPGEAARKWRDTMNEARTRQAAAQASGSPNLLEDVIRQMYEIGAIRFEPVTLKSGLVSPYYNNLRVLASYPPLLRRVAALMARTMQAAGVQPDLLVGIAEAGIPLAVALSQHTDIPAGYVRSSAKQHGTKRMVEGAWQPGATAVLVDDVVSDGASKLEVLGHLQEAGLQVRDIVVLVDRGQGGPELMSLHGLNCHAAVKMDDVLGILLKAGHITQQQVDESHRFMQEAKALTS